MKKILQASLVILLLWSCQSKGTGKLPEDKETIQQEVQTWLDEYNTQWQKLAFNAAEGQWKLNTYILKGDTVTAKEAGAAEEAYSAFTGNKEIIQKAQQYLKKKESLTALQVKQLEAILFMAANAPETAGDIVKKRIDAQNRQVQVLYDFNFMYKGKKVSTNDLDGVLRNSKNLDDRLEAWTASKEVGTVLKDRLDTLRMYRNSCVQGLDFKDYFAYQAFEYGWTSDELMTECNTMIRDIWPLYRELHTWARYELAARYNQPVPDYIPAHWLPNRWGQEWADMVSVEGINLDQSLGKKSAEWIVTEAEKFYISLGFDALPASFYEKSSLYPLPKNSKHSKNNHASAWHMDYDKDVRSLMSVEPNTNWWETTLHELGHIYYYITYSNKDVPIILRGGANRAYHEAMGSLIGLASLQQPFLEGYGLIPAGVQTDKTQLLLKEALNYVVLIPWSAGVMTGFEHDLYSRNLSKDQYNKRWWELVKKYQGIVPPSERGEEYCDAATKTHINDDAAQYYDYAMSNILLFQFHIHISNQILKQDPHATNYFGNKEIGKFLKALMYPGASVDWKEHLKKSIGQEMSAKPMLEYFAPLMEWLQVQNKGRTHTLPETL